MTLIALVDAVALVGLLLAIIGLAFLFAAMAWVADFWADRRRRHADAAAERDRLTITVYDQLGDIDSALIILRDARQRERGVA